MSFFGLLKKGYLLAYNLGSALGWFLILQSLFRAYTSGQSAGAFWAAEGKFITVVQSMAMAEVFHAVTGLVPSSPQTTLIQVLSRLVVLYAYTGPFEGSHTHWSLFLMVLAWALVEVPRYMFYAVAVFASSLAARVLGPVRYNLFWVLYPMGISGELGQIVTALPGIRHMGKFGLLVLAVLHLASYLPGSPYMYFHMVSARRKFFAKLASDGRAPPPPRGIQWAHVAPKHPKKKPAEGRPTLEPNRQVFLAACEGVPSLRAVADGVRGERNWRFGYSRRVVEYTKRLSTAPPADTITSAAQGLAAVRRALVFAPPAAPGAAAGPEVALGEYVAANAGGKLPNPFSTFTARGRGGAAEPFAVPYVRYRGNCAPPKADEFAQLRGSGLRAKAAAWAKAGVVEADAAAALEWASRDFDAQRAGIASSHVFILLGAGAAMGPLLPLLAAGATVVAVDLDRPGIWKRLLAATRAAPAGAEMIVPTRGKVDASADDDAVARVAGGDMLVEFLQIADWVCSVIPAGRRPVVGGYAYLDGEMHVRVSAAMDVIVEQVCKRFPNTVVASLCTPTDALIVPPAALDRGTPRPRAPAWLKAVQSLVHALGGGKMLRTNTIDAGDRVVDGIAPHQGPNYTLAKRVQHWRAVTQAAAAGHTSVSSHVAPSTATISVIHNPQFAAAYAGFGLFPPLEVFYQETSNAVMAAMLFYDLAGPAQPKPATPYGIFGSLSCHGGVWRCPFKIGSIGEVAAASHYLSAALPKVAVAMVAVVGTAWGLWDCSCLLGK